MKKNNVNGCEEPESIDRRKYSLRGSSGHYIHFFNFWTTKVEILHSKERNFLFHIEKIIRDRIKESPL